ncbi:hypothetical protein [Nonomuraea jabiensis]|uniref:hypothetical protein n=1 Tax=Nonomuraea jabiensis TaxID=882448 RepID=UPI003D74DAC7
MSSFEIKKIVSDTTILGDHAVVNKGLTGPPHSADVLDRLSDLIASRDQAEALPETVVNDIDAVSAEIQEGHGTSEVVRTRLDRIRQITENATAWAVVGAAAVELMKALGLA